MPATVVMTLTLTQAQTLEIFMEKHMYHEPDSTKKKLFTLYRKLGKAVGLTQKEIMR